MKRQRSGSTQSMTQDTQGTTSSRKSRRSKQVTFGIPRWAGKTSTGFPRELRIRHRYVQLNTFTSALGVTGTYDFSCNGMYDVDLTGAGHQPLYFDQLSAIYNHYTVVASKITVKCSTPNTANAAGTVFGIYINDDTTKPSANVSDLLEQSSAVYRNIASGAGELVLTKKWNAKENFGPAIGDPNLQGSSSANPVEAQNFTCVFKSADTTSTISMYVIVTVEYDAIWQELKDIGGS